MQQKYHGNPIKYILQKFIYKETKQTHVCHSQIMLGKSSLTRILQRATVRRDKQQGEDQLASLRHKADVLWTTVTTRMLNPTGKKKNPQQPRAPEQDEVEEVREDGTDKFPIEYDEYLIGMGLMLM